MEPDRHRAELTVWFVIPLVVPLVGSQGRAQPDPRTEERLRSLADRASGEFREITRAGLMTVRGTTRAGLVRPLVISQLVIPQAFAKNSVVSCSSDQRGKISSP